MTWVLTARTVTSDGAYSMWTASCLQLHPHGIIICDEAATVEMMVGTVSCFKDIEKANLDPKMMLKIQAR